MDITRCDKCGKEVYKTPYRFDWLKGTKPIDLCPACWSGFAEIVNNFLMDKNGEWIVKLPYDNLKSNIEV